MEEEEEEVAEREVYVVDLATLSADLDVCGSESGVKDWNVYTKSHLKPPKSSIYYTNTTHNIHERKPKHGNYNHQELIYFAKVKVDYEATPHCRKIMFTSDFQRRPGGGGGWGQEEDGGGGGRGG